MSGMQEAPGTVECNYAQADRITAGANNEERPIWAPEPCCHEARDLGRASGDSAERIVQHPTSEDERNGAETDKKLKSAIIPRAGASKGQGHSHARPRPVFRKVFCRAPRVQNANDNLDDQIRIFKEREDLRECRIPGMVSGISQKACEGWRRQATGRYSRYLGKVKLGLCKDCKYFNEPVVLD
ncbi:MAG: hypothetical protein ACLQPD_16890 [Desulfomonilaceae bacterium]